MSDFKCPKCDGHFPDGWEYFIDSTSDEASVECDDCGHVFTVFREATVSYSVMGQ